MSALAYMLDEPEPLDAVSDDEIDAKITEEAIADLIEDMAPVEEWALDYPDRLLSVMRAALLFCRYGSDATKMELHRATDELERNYIAYRLKVSDRAKVAAEIAEGGNE